MLHTPKLSTRGDLASPGRRLGPASTPDLSSYDQILLAFSGGKDSLACLLHLFDEGEDPALIELHHHDVDGRGPPTFD